MLSEEKLKLRSCNITCCLIEVVIQAGLTLVHLQACNFLLKVGDDKKTATKNILFRFITSCIQLENINNNRLYTPSHLDERS